MANEGKKVYAIFDNDGYECSSFIAVFSSREKADTFADRLRGVAAEEWALKKYEEEDARTISVMTLTLDDEPDIELGLRCLKEFAK